MSKSLIPKSKAKNAHELLSEVAALILAEPKRYSQHRYLSLREDAHRFTETKFPACGTVGCVAGWVVALKGTAGRRTPYSSIAPRAIDILGLTGEQSGELFHADALTEVLTDPGGRYPDPQTREHARAGVRHIRKFQKANRAQLLAKRIR